jgi:hypothetical protein
MEYLRDNMQELGERMGSLATQDEVEHMAALLADRGIQTFGQLDEMPDTEFFELIPLAIRKAGDATQ